MPRRPRRRKVQQTVVSTDGSCLGNPGPGGYSIVIRSPGHSQLRTISRGYRRTTNNRMEIMAVLAALETVPASEPVTIRSDSQYVVKAINLQWATNWRAHGWMRNRYDHAQNPDLWEKVLKAMESRTSPTTVSWIRGHSGDADNARADRLAKHAAHSKYQMEDAGYQKRLHHPRRTNTDPTRTPT